MSEFRENHSVYCACLMEAWFMVPPLECGRRTESSRSSKLLLIPLLLVVLTAASCPPPPDPQRSPFAEFEAFGPGGGYGAGSIVDRNIQPVVLDHDWQGLPFYRRGYPAGTVDYTSVTINHFSANAGVGGVDAVLGNMERITLTIRDGYIAIVSLEEVLEHIQTLDRDARTRLRTDLAPEGSSDRPSETMLRLLTEVLVVSDGTIEFHFRNSVDVDVGESVANFLAMELESFSRDNRTMTLKYSTHTAIGYKDPFRYDDGHMISSIFDKLNQEPTEIFYRDQDGDGVGGSDIRYDFVKSTGYSQRSGDCRDDDGDVFPGQESWFDVPNRAGNYDYNCDDQEVPQDSVIGECTSIRCADAIEGWDGRVPACGETERWLVGCELKGLVCTKEFEPRRQSCR